MRRTAVAVTALALLGGGLAAPSGGAAPRPRPRCADPMPPELTPPTVDVTLELGDTTLEEGQPLRLKLTARNIGPIPIPYSRGGQEHDLWIRDERGVIWLWSQQPGAFTDILVRGYMLPGETWTARTRWRSLCSPNGKTTRPGLPGPGRYVAQALWVSDVQDEDEDGDGRGAWWSNEVAFRIIR